jgi:hypothetical protein
LIDMLAARDYALYWHTPPLFRAGNFKGVAQNVFERLVSVNMLCIPAEIRSDVSGLIRIDPKNWASPLRRGPAAPAQDR